MSISFDLPQDVHQQLQLVLGDVGQAAKEALAIQGYSQRQFGIATLKGLLGLETKWQAEQWLAERGVALNYSADDLAEDCQTLNIFSSSP